MDELRNVGEGFALSFGTMAYLFGVIILVILVLEVIIRLVTLLRILVRGLVTLFRIFVLWPAWILIYIVHALTRLVFAYLIYMPAALLKLVIVGLARLFCLSARGVIESFKLLGFYSSPYGQTKTDGGGNENAQRPSRQEGSFASVQDIEITGRGHSRFHLHVFLSDSPDRCGYDMRIVVDGVEEARAWQITTIEGDGAMVAQGG